MKLLYMFCGFATFIHEVLLYQSSEINQDFLLYLNSDAGQFSFQNHAQVFLVEVYWS